MNECKVGADYDFINEMKKDQNTQDYFNSRNKNKDVVYKMLAHDVVYKLKNPTKQIPDEPLRNYVNHYMNETLSDEPPKIDPYDYEQKPISMARPYTLKGDFETLVPEIMDHH